MFDFKVGNLVDQREVSTAPPVLRVMPPSTDVVIRVNSIDTPINLIPIGNTPPANPAVGQLWIDTGDVI